PPLPLLFSPPSTPHPSPPSLHDALPILVGLGSYIEYPPSYCSGILYVNTFGGRTVALDSHNGHRIWQRFGAKKPSTPAIAGPRLDRKSTRLNSSHQIISYAVFCLKKQKK